MSQVVLESVRKVYDRGVVAIENMDLTVHDGEFLVLVGPSGCGKTTALRLIAGLEEPTAGTIRIGDRVVNRVPPQDRDVAMVFQDYALYPHMTVRKNLSFALKLRKTPKDEIERRVGRAAELLGLADVLERRPGALSGGQQQRVAVGRAIVREPKCYLLDEPLSNLDSLLRVQMRAELKSLHRRLGTTTLYVTHDQEEAMTLGARIAVMASGAVRQVGPPLEVYRAPVDRFVAGFLGNPPMNFVEGRVEDRAGELVFTDGAGVEMPLGAAEATIPEESADQPLVLGVRPEHLAPARDGGGRRADGRLRGTIDVVEALGDRVDVHASTADGVRVVARLDAAAASGGPGETITFRIDPRCAYLFERGTFGRRLR